jgi:PHD/YefM family antitoxin component YafN of YafNO toxin-antitoxin module
MVMEMTLSKTRDRLTSLHNTLERDVDTTIAITVRGKKTMALMHWDLYESLAETLEILGDQDLMGRLRKSLQEAKEGRLIPLDELERKYG